MSAGGAAGRPNDRTSALGADASEQGVEQRRGRKRLSGSADGGGQRPGFVSGYLRHTSRI